MQEFEREERDRGREEVRRQEVVLVEEGGREDGVRERER